ncbi:fructose-1,6-bisphosphate aldolase, class II [Candidatus Woesearchaeota archaeon CG10_big_fil_rev_8_21_14_0_10_30_7]|nr:MAG: fructose-1,6-bisphosphate aldolase, class II [Candidatus Woesearchaeota archaeon CG10_big_fil_rev_8_21_14_0_10_30_7]
MIITSKKLLDKAYKKHYAIGHFNINNLEILQAIILACEKTKSPAIIATSEGAIKYAGHKTIFNIIKNETRKSNIPFAIHLDHGRDMKIIKKSIQLGYTSIMIDGSHLKFEENIKLTKKVVNMCHKKNISVEGELGTIGGAEDLVESRKIILTDPKIAKEFIQKTGVDSLAIAIGTSHGAYKFVESKKVKLDIKRLQQINKVCKIPLVLHGASEVPQKYVKLIEKYGGKLEGVKGVPSVQLKKAISNGVAKVNTDTDLRLAFTAGMRKFFKENKKDIDPRHELSYAKRFVQDIVEHRIKELGSNGKM